MKKRYIDALLLPILLATALAVSGCPSPQQAATTVGSDDLLRRLAASYRSTPDLSVHGELRIVGEAMTIWFDAQSRLRDSLRLDLTGPFGVTLGAMSATPDTFIFYSPEEDIAVVGKPDRETFGKIMLIPLDYQEMSALVRGEIPRVPGAGEYTVESRDGALAYTVRSGTRTEEFTIDPSDLAVTSYRRSRRFLDSTLQELAIEFSNFTAVGERRFPRRASLEIAGGEQKVRVTIDRVGSRLDEETSLWIDIPEGVERRKL